MPVTSPDASVFPTAEEASRKVEDWQAFAEQGNFDADVHIVDPHAHYTMLDSLERSVILRSQYLRQAGDSTSFGPEKYAMIQELKMMPMTPAWVYNLVAGFQGKEDLANRKIIGCLCEVYRVLLGVIEGLELLKRLQKSKDMYSMLLERLDGTVAELVPIRRETLITFKEGLEVSISVALRLESTDLGGMRNALMECLLPLLESVLAPFGDLARTSDITDLGKTLGVCRVSVYMLDLGLVLYAGSHASTFDTLDADQHIQSMDFELESGTYFICNKRPLACLDGFLDAKSVWVFQVGDSRAAIPRVASDRRKLSILTTIDVLADVWGPVWAEARPAHTHGEKQRIRKYHVSKGCIWRDRAGNASEILGAVKCHWYNWAQDYARRVSSLFTDAADMYLDDKLLIGTDLEPNTECQYTLQEHQATYGHIMRPLGPKPSTWRLDGATAALQFTAPKVIAFQIQGNVKKVPETTIKQFLIDKWGLEPERANPGCLNSHFGVEISHCSGNARRVPLKAILQMNPIQELLERQIPGWGMTDWGLAFRRAMSNGSKNAIFKFWKDYVDARPLVGQLVQSVLDVLDDTGQYEKGLRAGFLYCGSELCIHINERNNEWAGLLKDSYLMATYAIVNDVCLEYRRPDDTTAICNDEARYTVLQTQIGLRKDDELKERLKIVPNTQTFKSVDDSPGLRILLVPEMPLKRAFLGNYNLAIGKELVDRSGNPFERFEKVSIRASGKSFGGMAYPRARASLAAQAMLVDSESVAAQEGLTQLELEKILKEQNLSMYGIGTWHF
ncbi:hypothetical protein BDV96DRAFT_200296 [Lophiotrema nucula]|uniref:Uncharacterized protein n=1 Tax=Lophiotrema nucula TaxID=690887 RepID=A0A6A5YW44_9PLEO|nr:hypothetical protein BDV96DRAFT_200296 [Lophiotrema nucula]